MKDKYFRIEKNNGQIGNSYSLWLGKKEVAHIACYNDRQLFHFMKELKKRKIKAKISPSN